MNRYAGRYTVSSTVAAVVLIIFVVGACARPARPKTLDFNTEDTEYSVSFDSSKISEQDMRNLIILSPVITNYAGVPGMQNFWAVGSTTGTVHDKALVPLPLELCLKDQPRYTNCEQNEIGSPNFLHNASINLEKSRQGLAWLRGLHYPRELQPVVAFLERGFAFSLSVEESTFKYYSTWDDTALTETHDGVDQEKVCPDVLKDLQAATTEKEKYAIVRTQWTSCVTQPTLRRFGRYPTEVWNKFLQDYRVQETYKEEGPD